jgi:hypothetical protein
MFYYVHLVSGPQGKSALGVTSKSAGKKYVDAQPKAGHDEQELF